MTWVRLLCALRIDIGIYRQKKGMPKIRHTLKRFYLLMLLGD